MIRLVRILGLRGSSRRTCPFCGNYQVYREARKGLRVRVICQIFPVNPYRCINCDNLFLAPTQISHHKPSTI